MMQKTDANDNGRLALQLQLMNDTTLRATWPDGHTMDSPLTPDEAERARTDAGRYDLGLFLETVNDRLRQIPDKKARLGMAEEVVARVPKALRDGITVEGWYTLEDAIAALIAEDNTCKEAEVEQAIEGGYGLERVESLAQELLVPEWDPDEAGYTRMVIERIEDARDSDDGLQDIGGITFAWTQDRITIPRIDIAADAEMRVVLFGTGSPGFTDEGLSGRDRVIEDALSAAKEYLSTRDKSYLIYEDLIWVTEEEYVRRLGNTYDMQVEDYLQQKAEEEDD